MPTSLMVPILIFVVVLSVLLVLYIRHWLRQLCLFFGLNLQKRRNRVLLRIGIALLACVTLAIFILPAVLLLHFFLICAIIELFAWLGKKCFPRLHPKRFLRTAYRLQLLPLLITVLVLIYAFLNMSQYVRTDYRLALQAPLSQEYRIVFLSDTHFGTLQKPELLKSAVAEINDLDADIIILGGDIVEEQTTNAQMHEAFAILGGLESRYGVFYIFGNHDKQSYTNHPTYSEAELTDTIRANGITVLEDEATVIHEELFLIGRADDGNSKRASLRTLAADAPKGMPILVADHQPNSGEECAELGAQVVLSGHTHGGQFIPLNFLTELLGSPTYGEYIFDECHLYVSSGFAGWGFPLRTAEHCEYLVLTLS